MPESQYVIYSSESFSTIAGEIVMKNPELFIRGKIKWGRFPDGTPDIFVEGVEQLYNKHVILLLGLSSPESYFPQISVYRYLAKKVHRSFTALCPFFPTATMERADKVGVVATAHSLAEEFSYVMPGTRLILFDVHALAIENFFDATRVKVEFRSWIKDEVNKLPLDIVIGFPDEGAFKGFRIMITDPETGELRYAVAICSKRRIGKSGEGRKVWLLEGNVHGKDVYLMDDLIHTGGTLIEAKLAFEEAGARSVSVISTHGVMENNAHLRLAGAGFRNIVISNTVPKTAAKVKDLRPFQVISITDNIIKAITRR